ncbi:MAG: hypothetical protein RL318_1092, partial [Fibrobacterota bacterium]
MDRANNNWMAPSWSRLLLALVLTMACTGFAAKPAVKVKSSKIPLVAVVPLTGAGIDEATSLVVTDALSHELIQSGEVRVMERSQMEQILKERGFQQSGACTGSDCVIEMGKLLSIDKMVVGSVGKLGSSHTISVRVVDVATGEVLGSARRAQKGEIDDLMIGVMPELVAELVAATQGKKPVPRKEDPPVAAVASAPQPVVVAKPAPSATEGMVKIPAGTFMMGTRSCGIFSGEGAPDQCPRHEVVLDSFWMDRTEVTQGAYRRVMGENPSKFNACGDDCPVDNVSWNEALEYCQKVGKRLPTEAQWEYAARAGTSGKWSWGADNGRIGEHAWYNGNSASSTHPVARKLPNAWGLHDMAGNVREWVNDFKGDYPSGPQSNPTGPKY